MKFSHLLIIALFGSFVTVVSCNDKKEDPASQTTTVTPDINATAQDPTLVASTPAAGGSEFHFKCPKNCEGGGASNKGNCPICGTELVHNQAFHNQAPGAEGSSPQTPIQIDPTNASPSTVSATPTPKPTQAEPAQNAKGIWHWTCAKGCEGGAGGAGNCAKCGGPLSHNSTYHQQ